MAELWYTRKFDACAAQIAVGCDGPLAETLALGQEHYNRSDGGVEWYRIL